MRATRESRTDECSAEHPEVANNQLAVDVANKRKRRMSTSSDYSETNEWDTEDYFKPEWLDQIKQYQIDLIPFVTVSKNKIWFEYLFNANNPEKSRYRCRICHKYYDALSMEANYKTALAFEEGVLKTTRKKNADKINKHAISRAHKEIIGFLVQGKKKKLSESFTDIQHKEDMKHEALKVTAQMIRTVYVEIKANIPMYSHRQIVLLQEAHGVNMGFHHFDRESANRMMAFISDTMHTATIKSILESNKPISFIADGSKDITAIPYLITYFQTIEENVPVLYFYKLIPTTSKHTGEDYFNIIIESFQKEGDEFVEYLKNNLVAFVSDGEPVMRGRNIGVFGRFIRFANHKIIGIHCMAHKLELAIEHAIKGRNYITDFNACINKIYTFYYSQDGRRIQHLRETTVDMDNSRFFQLVYLYTIRWISSETRAIRNIRNNIDILFTDLSNISLDDSFSDATPSEAREMHWKIRGKNFLVLLHFLLGLLLDFGWWSKRMQARAALLVDFKHFNQELVMSLENLKLADPNTLISFFKETVCGREKCNNYESYYASDDVVYKSLLLINDDEKFQRLPQFRDSLIDALISELQKYFPNKEFENFDIFLPNKLPFANQDSIIARYGQTEVLNLCIFYEWHEDCFSISEEWRNLLTSVVEHEYYCRLRNGKFVEFWSKFLHVNTTNILWTPATIKMFHTIFAIPVGSVEAERGFSIMNHIKYKRRGSLTAETLDHLMRVRINGPNKLEEFPAMKYAVKWVEKGHIRTDSPNSIKVKPTYLDESEKSENEQAQSRLTEQLLPQSALF